MSYLRYLLPAAGVIIARYVCNRARCRPRRRVSKITGESRSRRTSLRRARIALTLRSRHRTRKGGERKGKVKNAMQRHFRERDNSPSREIAKVQALTFSSSSSSSLSFGVSMYARSPALRESAWHPRRQISLASQNERNRKHARTHARRQEPARNSEHVRLSNARADLTSANRRNAVPQIAAYPAERAFSASSPQGTVSREMAPASLFLVAKRREPTDSYNRPISVNLRIRKYYFSRTFIYRIYIFVRVINIWIKIGET